MEQPLHAHSWPICLALRENLQPTNIPHIPMPIKDIARYASLPDYKEDYIKSVLTIGEILSLNGSTRLRNISSDSDVEVILSLERLTVNDLYFKDEKRRYLPIWEKFRVVKVWGTLEQKENKVLLIAHKLVKVEDIPGSLKILLSLSAIARLKYDMYM